MREKLIKILREPIFPHELADPTEAVSDYLLDNDVVPVVRCKHCDRRKKTADLTDTVWCMWYGTDMPKDGFCSYGEKREGE